MKQNLVQRAKAFAIEKHKNCRYGELPYEFHLEAVVRELPENASEELKAAAWLHDTVEDTSVTLFEIRELFGGKVARLVDVVTDEPGANRKERKAGMYKKLVAGPAEGRALKLADRLANMRASAENPKKKAMYRKEFPEFIKKVAGDPENQEMVLEAFWLYLTLQEE